MKFYYYDKLIKFNVFHAQTGKLLSPAGAASTSPSSSFSSIHNSPSTSPPTSTATSISQNAMNNSMTSSLTNSVSAPKFTSEHEFKEILAQVSGIAVEHQILMDQNGSLMSGQDFKAVLSKVVKISNSEKNTQQSLNGIYVFENHSSKKAEIELLVMNSQEKEEEQLMEQMRHFVTNNSKHSNFTKIMTKFYEQLLHQMQVQLHSMRILEAEILKQNDTYHKKLNDLHHFANQKLMSYSNMLKQSDQDYNQLKQIKVHPKLFSTYQNIDAQSFSSTSSGGSTGSNNSSSKSLLVEYYFEDDSKFQKYKERCAHDLNSLYEYMNQRLTVSKEEKYNVEKDAVKSNFDKLQARHSAFVVGGGSEDIVSELSEVIRWKKQNNYIVNQTLFQVAALHKKLSHTHKRMKRMLELLNVFAEKYHKTLSHLHYLPAAYQLSLMEIHRRTTFHQTLLSLLNQETKNRAQFNRHVLSFLPKSLFSFLFESKNMTLDELLSSSSAASSLPDISVDDLSIPTLSQRSNSLVESMKTVYLPMLQNTAAGTSASASEVISPMSQSSMNQSAPSNNSSISISPSSSLAPTNSAGTTTTSSVKTEYEKKIKDLEAEVENLQGKLKEYEEYIKQSELEKLEQLQALQKERNEMIEKEKQTIEQQLKSEQNMLKREKIELSIIVSKYDRELDFCKKERDMLIQANTELNAQLQHIKLESQRSNEQLQQSLNFYISNNMRAIQDQELRLRDANSRNESLVIEMEELKRRHISEMNNMNNKLLQFIQERDKQTKHFKQLKSDYDNSFNNMNAEIMSYQREVHNLSQSSQNYLSILEKSNQKLMDFASLFQSETYVKYFEQLRLSSSYDALPSAIHDFLDTIYNKKN